MIQAIILCPNAKIVFAGQKSNQCTVIFLDQLKMIFILDQLKKEGLTHRFLKKI